MKLLNTMIVLMFVNMAFSQVMSGGQPNASDSDLMFWLKADALTGLSNGDLVMIWADASANGLDFYAEIYASPGTMTGTVTPTYVASGLNGLPTVGFDGDDWLGVPQLASTVSDPPLTMIVVFSEYWGTSDGALVNFAHSVNGYQQSTLFVKGTTFHSDSRHSRTGDGSNLQSFVDYGTLGSPVIGMATFENLGSPLFGLHYPSANGVASEMPNLCREPVYDRIGVGAVVRQVYPNNFVNYFTGQISEVLVYSRVLSQAEINNIGGYLAEKYGINYVQQPLVMITGAAEDLTVSKRGMPADYSIILSGPAPTANVVVSPATDLSEITVSPSSVVFTPSDYDIPKQLTVTAIDDGIQEEEHTTSISHTVSSSDVAYDSLPVDGDPITVTVYDTQCGRWGYFQQDLNQDCYVNLDDLSSFVAAWLACTDPENEDCVIGPIPKNDLWLEKTVLRTMNTDGYAAFKIPTLISTPSGSLLAIFEGRVDDRTDDAQTRLLMRKSHDSGKTWATMKVIYSEEGVNQTIGNPTPVIDDDTNTIWLFFCRNNYDVLLTKSEDDGQTWSQPEDLTVQLRKPEQQGFYATGPGHGIQLQHGAKKGRLVVTAYAGQITTPDEPAGSKSFVIYSDDHGLTWQAGDTTRLGAPDTADGNECMVVELPDDSLYMTIRDNFESGYRAYACSGDAGNTWSDIAFDPNLPESICQASILAIQTPQGQDAVLFCNPAIMNQNRTDKEPRRNLTLKISFDGCNTWPVSKVLELGPSAYSDLVVLPDGNFGCFYEAGAVRYDEELVFAKFSYKWLTFDPLAN